VGTMLARIEHSQWCRVSHGRRSVRQYHA